MKKEKNQVTKILSMRNIHDFLRFHSVNVLKLVREVTRDLFCLVDYPHVCKNTLCSLDVY